MTLGATQALVERWPPRPVTTHPPVNREGCSSAGLATPAADHAPALGSRTKQVATHLHQESLRPLR